MAKKNSNDNSNSSSPSPYPSGVFFFKIHNIELLFWLNFVYLLMILCDYIFVLNKEVIEIELIKRNRLLLM
jgi:hypothetical protein